jgi:hypothetical protein
MTVTELRATKSVCVPDEINTKNAQVKAPTTLQANITGRYIN